MRHMRIAYWVIAVLLAAFYLYSGGKKAAQSKEQLAPMMGWVDTAPMGLVRFLGVVEILGALGLVLPPLTGIAPVLALLAAAGLLVLQVLAAGFHVSRGEANLTGLNAGLIVLAGVEVWLATVWL